MVPMETKCVSVKYVCVQVSLGQVVEWVGLCRCLCEVFNILRSDDTFMHHQTRPSLGQIMAWHLLGAKPLSEPMLVYGSWFPECICL